MQPASEVNQFDSTAAGELLKWYIENGINEAIGDCPVNRYALAPEGAEKEPQPRSPRTEASPGRYRRATEPAFDPVEVAEGAASRAASRDELKQAMAEFELCELKKGARNLVFSDGNPAAEVMIVGEAPGRDEDLKGLPFVGQAGRLLDRMFGRIGLSRQETDPRRSLYVTNVLPWRPPSNRTPTASEIGMLRPFVSRHVALVSPRLLILMGNVPCTALLRKSGITRMRGVWVEFAGTPVLPMFHPAYLLRNPEAKRETWSDLLEVSIRIRGGHDGRG